MTTTAIALRYDTAYTMWVISLDEINDAGEAESSESIRAEEDYDNALAVAETHARVDGLPIFEDGEFLSHEQ